LRSKEWVCAGCEQKAKVETKRAKYTEALKGQNTTGKNQAKKSRKILNKKKND